MSALPRPNTYPSGYKARADSKHNEYCNKCGASSVVSVQCRRESSCEVCDPVELLVDGLWWPRPACGPGYGRTVIRPVLDHSDRAKLSVPILAVHASQHPGLSAQPLFIRVYQPSRGTIGGEGAEAGLPEGKKHHCRPYYCGDSTPRSQPQSPKGYFAASPYGIVRSSASNMRSLIVLDEACDELSRTNPRRKFTVVLRVAVDLQSLMSSNPSHRLARCLCVNPRVAP